MKKFTIIIFLFFSINVTSQTTLEVTAKSGLTIRQSPNLIGKKLGLLPFGKRVELIEKTGIKQSFFDDNEIITGEWIKVEFDNYPSFIAYPNEGYVFNGYLKTLNINEINKSPNSFSNNLKKEVENSPTVIKLKKISGVYQIPCLINGQKFNFIFDTGASNVSLSLEVAEILYSKGLIKSSDIIGKEFFQFADGNISEGLVLNLKEITIGDIVLKNVRASILNTTKAPLLLGQTALERLGKYSFDYYNNELSITGNKNIDLTNYKPKKGFVYINKTLSDDGKIGKWIAEEQIEVYDNIESSNVISYLKTDEKFYAIESKFIFYKMASIKINNVLPNLFDDCEEPPFVKGDLVYMLNYEGEDYYRVLYNNKVIYAAFYYNYDGSKKIRTGRYDACNRITGVVTNNIEESDYWVKIKKLNGEVGWIKNPNCYTVRGRRPGCYNSSSPAW
ncbi:retroviral-like aspartic protease family protein [Lutibacter sp. B1]|uniref:retroviral-like aspartic protease family protein n=1 Tax=Lutibacter sp. B1 TaxID=2725996 RepID=UPI0014566C13|nr:retroviral-like aspartic protease family protein [Lutibacter sp. B1]NLP59440.1 SH3 domain-containing protein [Lutibacter sp. B1]